MKNWKKIIISGLLVGILMFVLMMVLTIIEGLIFPQIHTEYENVAIFRPYEDPIVYYFYIHPLIIGIIFCCVWHKVKDIVKEQSLIKNGAQFGLCFWLIATIPGLFLGFSIYQISALMFITTVLSTLIQQVIAGIFTVYFDRKFNNP